MNRFQTFALIATFAAGTVHMPATAAPVGNQQLSLQSELQLQRDDVRTLLNREDVRSALQGYGVSAADAEQRINNMTAGELQQIHDRMSTLPAGEGALSAVLTVLLILILLDVVGATDIFPGI
ncbi:MAG: PA2779 family protein [Pseudohongiellaceae bacterium]